MAKKLSDAIIEIQTLAGTMSGVRKAPTSPPDKMSHYPFVICYPGTGTITKMSAGWKQGLQTVILEIHVARKDMARDVAKLIDYEDDLMDLLWADSNSGLSSTADTITEIRYQFGALDYDDTATIGWRFEIDIKIQDTV